MVASANAATAQYGAAPITVEHWRQIVTRPTALTYGIILGKVVTDEDWQRLEVVWLDNYVRNAHRVRMAEGAREALAAVRALGLTQSVVSLHDGAALRDHIRELGVEEYFDAIAGVDEDTPGGQGSAKTNMLAAHLRELGVAPSQVVVIGDVTDDADAARAVGASAILVTCGDTAPERLVDDGSPLADSLLEAVGLLEPVTSCG